VVADGSDHIASHEMCAWDDRFVAPEDSSYTADDQAFITIEAITEHVRLGGGHSGVRAERGVFENQVWEACHHISLLWPGDGWL
jgi:hypothetical protein